MGSFDYIARGGWIMYPLIGLSIYVLMVIILKILQFQKLQVLNNNYVNDFLLHIKSGEKEKAEKLLATKRGPVAKILTAAYILIRDENLNRDKLEAEVERVGTTEIRILESHLRGLELTGNIAPLLGLLGTVIGMIKAFAELAESGSRVDPSILAEGIWEALITTVGGLMVAIPAVAAYYIIDSYVEKVRVVMKDSVTRLMLLEKKIKSHSHASHAKKDKVKAPKAAH